MDGKNVDLSFERDRVFLDLAISGVDSETLLSYFSMCVCIVDAPQRGVVISSNGFV